MPPDTGEAIICFVAKRVPVTGHPGYTHSLDVIRAGIDGLEHAWISPYNEFCALNMQFGASASMMDPNFRSSSLKVGRRLTCREKVRAPGSAPWWTSR